MDSIYLSPYYLWYHDKFLSFKCILYFFKNMIELLIYTITEYNQMPLSALKPSTKPT